MISTPDRIDEPATIGERYSRASESSDLRVKEGSCDADLLIAAGWAGNALGAVLYRLRSEFDQAAGDLRRAEAEVSRLLVLADQEAKSVAVGPTRAELHLRSARQTVTTERALILLQLGSLTAAKEALGRWAVQQATLRKFERPDGAALVLAGRTLDVFLAPNCGHCGGRGFSGGGRHEHSGPQVICRPCGGSGKRGHTIGRDDEERRFGGFLLAEMQRVADAFETRMRRRLRSNAS